MSDKVPSVVSRGVAEPGISIQEKPEDDASDLLSQDLDVSKSTWEDKAHMQRMGHKQQLIRQFKSVQIIAFTVIAVASWELGLFTLNQALVDGGRPCAIYSILWNFIFFIPIYLSMAEMASMAPIAGSQYHWVSEFAPAKYQKVLSYLNGWTSTVALQAGNALGVFLTGTLIQVIILVNDANYAFPNWQGTLFVIATVVLTYVANVYGSKYIPSAQVIVFALHVTVYIAILVPIWVNAPKATHSQVWTEFSNTGGWSNMGFTVLVGQLTGIYMQTGVDAAAHMSEDTRNAGKMIPRAMMITFFFNSALIFPAVITLCYAMPDLQAALDDPSEYPFVYVLKASMSEAWVTVFLVLIILILTCANISYLSAVTRDLFAFARDNGVPFSKWISQVHPTRRVPQNACIVTSIFSILLSLIYIGSPIAFYAITSLFTVAILQCYTFSIGCVLWRRLKYPDTLPPAQYSLGRWGLPLNICAVVYGAWAFFWSFWPMVTPITASGFNWASVIFITCLIIAGFYYTFRARHKYEGPVVLVEGRVEFRQ